MILRGMYFFLGLIVSFLLTLQLTTFYNNTEQQMYRIAKSSYLTGCLKKEVDCVKASVEFENNLRLFIDFRPGLR